MPRRKFENTFKIWQTPRLPPQPKQTPIRLRRLPPKGQRGSGQSRRSRRLRQWLQPHLLPRHLLLQFLSLQLLSHQRFRLPPRPRRL
jgi:hypothetical protein